MEKILDNFQIINQLSYRDLLQALIYKELEGSEVETSKTHEELKEFITDLADEWYNTNHLNLVPNEIHEKIFN